MLPELLGAHGYRTGYFGKIHYGAEGPGDRACPEQHGFDSSFYGLTSTSSGRLHYLLHSREARERLGEQHQAVHGISPMYEDGREVDCERHLTSEFADRAIDFMGPAPAADAAGGGVAEDPFFCMVAFNAVHNFAWQLPEDELAARALPSRDDFDPETEEYLDWYDGAISPNLENGRAYYLPAGDHGPRDRADARNHLKPPGGGRTPWSLPHRQRRLHLQLRHQHPLHGTSTACSGAGWVPFMSPGRAGACRGPLRRAGLLDGPAAHLPAAAGAEHPRPGRSTAGRCSRSEPVRSV